MTYKIDQIEGIGADYATRLSSVGVRTTDDLRARCATEEARWAVAQQTGISTTQLGIWVHQADLMRVSGIGSEFGQLLEASGVETVEELSQRKPENIVNLLHRVNAEKRLTRALPSLKTVVRWVTRARDLLPKSAASTSAAPEPAPMPRTAPVFSLNTPVRS